MAASVTSCAVLYIHLLFVANGNASNMKGKDWGIYLPREFITQLAG